MGRVMPGLVGLDRNINITATGGGCYVTGPLQDHIGDLLLNLRILFDEGQSDVLLVYGHLHADGGGE